MAINNSQETIILIPARMASMRLPGKPLADIAGKPMIVHVAERARESAIGRVVVAVDNDAVFEAVDKAGFEAVMTGPDHQSGSDRIHEALGKVDPDGRARLIVNVQGDLPTLDPTLIAASLAPLEDPAVDIATLTVEIIDEAEKTASQVVKIVGSPISATRLRALYFTRATRPLGRRSALSSHRTLYLSARGA